MKACGLNVSSAASGKIPEQELCGLHRSFASPHSTAELLALLGAHTPSPGKNPFPDTSPPAVISSCGPREERHKYRQSWRTRAENVNEECSMCGWAEQKSWDPTAERSLGPVCTGQGRGSVAAPTQSPETLTPGSTALHSQRVSLCPSPEQKICYI